MVSVCVVCVKIVLEAAGALKYWLDAAGYFCYSNEKEKVEQMYEETLKRKPLRGFGTFLSILIVVFTILLLMLLVGWVQILWNIGYLQYILLAVVLACLLLMLFRQLTKYYYVLGEGRVLIYRGVGKTQKSVFAFPVQEIEQFGKIDEIDTGKKRRLFLFKNMEKDAFCIVLSRVIVVFAPSEMFIQKLKEEYEKARC